MLGLLMRWLLLLMFGCASAPPPGDAAWTLIVLPDTQHYAERHPETFLAQARWITENAVARNIRFVVHVGDVVEHNAPDEWDVAARAFSLIPVPYAIALGNHDLGTGKAETRETLFHTHFPEEGERFESSSAHLFSAGGRDWIVLALEWGPRDRTIAWANRTLARHSDRAGIIVTHAYLYSDGTRADHRKKEQRWNPHTYGTAGGVNDGEELWTKLISQHENVVFVLCGHYGEDGGAARAVSVGKHGNRVHELLSDYQLRDNGGDGYLRIMAFDGDRVRVTTYSPTRNDTLDDPANTFELPL
jgi:hypothetical protein